MQRRQLIVSGILALAGFRAVAAPAVEPPECSACAPGDPSRFKPSLLLALKNRSYLSRFSDTARAQGQPEAKPLYKPLAADVIVVPVEDRESMSRFVAAGEGRQFGLSDKEVFDAAFANLKRRVGKLQIHDYGPVRALAFDANYNASLLLVPEVWSSVPELPDNLVVAVPARDILAFGDGAVPQTLAGLRKIAAMPSDGFPVTTHLLKRTGGRWSVLG